MSQLLRTMPRALLWPPSVLAGSDKRRMLPAYGLTTTGNVPFVIFGRCCRIWGQKGSVCFIVWSIYQVGAVIGAAVPVGQNWSFSIGSNSRVKNGTYIGLIVLMLCGACLRWHYIPGTDSRRRRLSCNACASEHILEETEFLWPRYVEIGEWSSLSLSAGLSTSSLHTRTMINGLYSLFEVAHSITFCRALPRSLHHGSPISSQTNCT